MADSHRKCHCGSVMIELFTGFACKAECDLPPSMQSRNKAAPKRLYNANVSLSFGGVPVVGFAPATPIWVPAVGDWVRITAGDPYDAGKILRIDQGGGGRWSGFTPDRGLYFTRDASALEPWVPRIGERVVWSLVVGLPATVRQVYDDGSAEIRYDAGAHYVAAFVQLTPAP